MAPSEGHGPKEKKKTQNVGFNVPAGKLLLLFFPTRSTKVTLKAFFSPLGSLHLTWQNSVLQEDIRRLSRHIKSRQEARGLMCWGEAQMSVPALSLSFII